jgi:hypothetical protein
LKSGSRLCSVILRIFIIIQIGTVLSSKEPSNGQGEVVPFGLCLAISHAHTTYFALLLDSLSA